MFKYKKISLTDKIFKYMYVRIQKDFYSHYKDKANLWLPSWTPPPIILPLLLSEEDPLIKEENLDEEDMEAQVNSLSEDSTEVSWNHAPTSVWGLIRSLTY